ncbi:gamma-glutamyl-gamma-aminobutyrate hydrolase family protein [Yinghuangia seranimata]|uniref:gamma-glutamyl-gamma-aminobutyrate hydrolase family protein n=1 Tax=Yinghuangia seranimata TaxID=408067 RepID=UPI00248C346E|nr:gamma-glutamyl-gamma-aminobutyrate hydrolase family protein [Yinghuangia seranimata]MDI2127435.1 gamma-glutamyl-gamma-aminobutyrate hydrolase family protein [Yinghuangia seranimata]
MSRPVIGITVYSEQAKWAAWDVQATLLPQAYVDRVAAAGGLPVLLPSVPDIAEALDRIDGLVVAGGGDVDPARYRSAAHELTGWVRPARDTAEFALAEGALARRMPVLGICRGLQVLNVLRGGTLVQHLPDRLGDTRHAPAPGQYGRHAVTLVDGSRTAQLYGRTEIDVATYHHQAVDSLGAGLVVTGRAPDGTVEAVELPGQPFAVAVQWHPEVDPDLSPFTGLVAAATAWAHTGAEPGTEERTPVDATAAGAQPAGAAAAV